MDARTYLRKLVAFDTRNPQGRERPLLEFCAEELARLSPDELVLSRVPRTRGGEPTGYLYVRFGSPRLLVNVHVDTVPASGDWSASPFELQERGGRLVGLGSSDTKGSLAALLAALRRQAPRDFAILLSGDEELGNEAMQAFLEARRLDDVELCIVCEPTEGRFAGEHRGILFYEVVARGPGGHSSRADQLPKPALELAHVAVALGELAQRKGPGSELCLNVAGIETGAAFNVIPSKATLVISARPAPGVKLADVRAELEHCMRTLAPDSEVLVRTAHASFKMPDPSVLARYVGASELCSVPFWTEAAMLAERGVNAVVYGPGDIGQAHAADESIEISRLQEAQALFERLSCFNP